MIRGLQYHSIILGIFNEVHGYNESEQIQVNCPFCQERDGLSEPDGKFNLEINTHKKIFKCWKCEQPSFSGSLGKLIKLFGTIHDYELYSIYNSNESIYDEDVEDDEFDENLVLLPSEMILFSMMDINNPLHIEAYNYMIVNRKIDKNLLYKYHIGFCINGKYNKRIIIPSYDNNGNVNYFVARSYDPKNKKFKYLNPDVNKNLIIFNEGYINWDFTIYIIEGVFEMLSIPNNGILLLGKNLTEVIYKKIEKYKPNIIIILDPDAYLNGLIIYYKLLSIYDDENKVKIVDLTYDNNKFDLDELRINYGNEYIVKILRTAKNTTIDDNFLLNTN